MLWIEAKLVGDTGKTKVWDIVSKEGAVPLGQVKWFGRWRKYAFFPKPDTVYEAYCLADLADFCREHTKAWWAAKKKGGP